MPDDLRRGGPEKWSSLKVVEDQNRGGERTMEFRLLVSMSTERYRYEDRISYHQTSFSLSLSDSSLIQFHSRAF